MMFVVCFGDGLGNQMFQYAFYKSLQQTYPENDVFMDIYRIYGKHIHNGFELTDIFGIPRNEVQLVYSLRLADYWPDTKLYYKVMNKIHNLRRHIFGIKPSHIKQDDPTGFYKSVFELEDSKSYLLCGNWVNEKYFENVKEEVIKDFQFPPITDEHNMEYLNQIQESESVSVHIRKGDYIGSAMINLGVDYYKLAKKELELRVKNPKYFIFTDDKNAISEYLELFDEYVIVEGNSGNQSFRDMQLMSNCKHNIIPNSTFSFWGAYLNKNPEKVVIAPSKAKHDFRHPFACADWTVIPYLGEEKANNNN